MGLAEKLITDSGEDLNEFKATYRQVPSSLTGKLEKGNTKLFGENESCNYWAFHQVEQERAERAKKEREEQEANQPDYDYSAIRTDVPAVEKKQDVAQQEDHHKDEL